MVTVMLIFFKLAFTGEEGEEGGDE